MRELLRDGVSILFISHRRDEIERMAGHISVLRDGRLVLSAPARDVSQDELVRAMLGDATEASAKVTRSEPSRSATAIRVRGLTTRGRGALEDVSFEAREGEVLGFAGLGGSGAALTLAALVGEAGLLRGECELFGKAYRPESPAASLRDGVAFLPADRARSVFPELSVVWNATLSSLARYTTAGWVSKRRELRDALEQARASRLKASAVALAAAELSGGNQQKLALMRCLLAGPRLLLLDDPTRGVDAAAKSEIAGLLRERAARGLCVLVFSSELEELTELCDRVLVFFAGRVVSELVAPSLDRERMLEAMMGSR
jgi:ribose transport system ATP-binding protein